MPKNRPRQYTHVAEEGPDSFRGPFYFSGVDWQGFEPWAFCFGDLYATCELFYADDLPD